MKKFQARALTTVRYGDENGEMREVAAGKLFLCPEKDVEFFLGANAIELDSDVAPVEVAAEPEPEDPPKPAGGSEPSNGSAGGQTGSESGTPAGAPSSEATGDGDGDGDEAATDREALEARAAELGITVRANMKDETISKKIAEAEAEDDESGDEDLV